MKPDLTYDRREIGEHVTALEKDLGTLLFIRSTRVLKLTPDGARFHRDCVHILKRLNDATQRLRTNEATPNGPLKVGMAPGLRRRLLLLEVPEFQRRFPQIDLTLLSVDDRAAYGAKGIDVLIRARGVRQHGAARSEPQGLVVRRLFQSPYVICASPTYLARAGIPRAPTDLLTHACLAHVSLDHDVAHEWRFSKGEAKQIARFVPRLRVQGVDALVEAGVAGGGMIRVLAVNAEMELRTRALVPVLEDWECTGAPPMQAIYRKTKPMLPQLSAFVRAIAAGFRRYER